MRASFLIKPGLIHPSQEISTPIPGPGEVLLRVKAALTCGTDLKAFLRGHPMIPMPGPFGHEFSGIVESVGRGVRKFRKGDPVMSVHSAPCLSCQYCKRGLRNLCERIMDTKVMGAFAEFILLPPHIVKQNAYPKPDGLSFEEAALLEPMACVMHGIAPLTIKQNQCALVLGAGPIGLMHVMLLKAHGLSVAIADPHAGRLSTARLLGADRTIKLSPDPATRAAQTLRGIKAFTSGSIGVDYVFECTGRPGVWEQSVDYVRRGGTVTLFGGCPSGSTVAFDAHRLHYDEITLRGVFHFTPPDVKKAYALLTSGTLNTRALISDSYTLDEIAKPFEKLRKGKGIKYAILP